MSVDEVANRLNSTLEHLQRARSEVRTATAAWDEAADTFATTTIGSTDPEVSAWALIAEAMPELVEDITDLLSRLTAEITKVRNTITGTSRTAAPSSLPTALLTSAGSSRRPATVTNQHGDTYPAAAAGLVEDLPPRVVPNRGDRTVGVPVVAGVKREPISSGYHPRWTGEAERLLLAHGYNPERLKYHVEIKAAAMMIVTGQTRVELATNYTSCGAELQRLRPDTCHKVLAKLLPTGYRLTVYGTTQDNQPWQQTYGE